MPDPFDVDRHCGGERRTRGLDAALATLAGRQHGVVARRQLRALGLGDDAIDLRLRRGRLHTVHRGVYAVGHAITSREGTFMAAVLAGGDAVLSHRSAAALWGVIAAERQDVEISVPRALRPRPRLEIHQARLPADEVTTHRSIPVTTPARTLYDLASVLPPHRLERAATEAEIRRLTSPTSLEALVARYPRRAGNAAIRGLLATQAIGRYRTRRELEARFLAFLDEAGLPRPQINATVELPCRPREVDCLWEDRRLVAELDGFATHGTRSAFEEDRARDRALQAAGYRVVRITWRQLHAERATIAAQLRALLASA
jgi:predicted transcriptional regulator of viral defense system